MRKIYLLLWVIVTLCVRPAMSQMLYDWDKVSPRLADAMLMHPDQKQRVVILLSDQVDIASLEESFYAQKSTLEERTYTVITLLKAKAEATQPVILDYLMHNNEVNQSSVTPLWITNMIVAEVSPSVLVELSWREEIGALDIDNDIQNEPFRVEPDGDPHDRSVGGHEKGLDAINAPAMWAFGYTGYRRVAMSIDTGIDFTHPAIDNQFRGNYVPANQAWYESNTSNTTPFDCDQHGTHTMGTMLGLNQDTHDTIGVAFNGTWIASPGLCNSNKYLAFQWAIDPDNNANTIFGDFGAATMYDLNDKNASYFERLDVRAFGCLMEDLLNQNFEATNSLKEFLIELKEDCMDNSINKRSSFDSIELSLTALKKSTS